MTHLPVGVGRWRVKREQERERPPVLLHDASTGQGAGLAATAELREAVESVAEAGGALKVEKIWWVSNPGLQRAWELERQKLAHRSKDDSFPKPSWDQRGDDSDRAILQHRERKDVLHYLLSRSEPVLDGVWATRFFQGPPDFETAAAVCSTGLAGNVQKVKGWYGEGSYVSLTAPYALRYALGMKELYECEGQVGFLVAGRAVFSQVYPVTQADNSESPLDPGLKGKPVGGRAAAGLQGVDAHFVCVRGVPPYGSELRRTYHACMPGERPEGTELVASQDSQYLPEYIIEVRVTSDRAILRRMRVVAEHFGRAPPASRAAGWSLALALKLGRDLREVEESDFDADDPSCDAPELTCPKCSRRFADKYAKFSHVYYKSECYEKFSLGEKQWLKDWFGSSMGTSSSWTA
mmetsp:Transcript_16862/g.52770  ORF Transcript_16862/g.52770 Transcript_16862/m.52770 type:complete len:408 (-) Transcript_16862:59-1282(-)